MAIIIVDWCVRVSLMESQWPIFSYIVLLLGICTIFDSAYLELCMLNSVLATLESSKGTLGCLRGGDMWGTTPSCLIWCIWEERSCRTFEGKELSLPNLKFLFMNTLYEWSFKSYTFFTFSFADFLDDSLLSLSLRLCNFI